MQDRPTVHELLHAVIRFIDDDAVPHLTGSRQFYGRVAANALRTVQRELEHEEEYLTEEWERLNQVLTYEDRPSTRAGLRQAMRRRTEALCERIRHGEADTGAYRKLVLAHVRASVREKLLVSNPGWITRPES